MKFFFWITLLLLASPSFAKLNIEWIGGEVYDFGLIKESKGIQTGEFKLVNRGRKSLTITDIKMACGCTKVDYTHGKIQKGDTAFIKVLFDPDERPGSFDKGIYVTLNKEKIPINLRIKGTVMASPATLKLFYPIGFGNLRFDTDTIDFGEMKRGLRRREFLDIYNSGLKSCRPEFSSRSNALRFELSPEEIKPGEGATLTVYLESSQLMWLGEKTVPIKVKWGKNQEEELQVKVKLVP